MGENSSHQLFQSLAKMEDAREALHTALREAAFQYSTTSHLEEQRGHLISFDAVPTAANSLSPACFIARSTAAGDGEEVRERERGDWALVIDDAPQHLGDSLLCFSAAPSRDLRECRSLYRKVLRLAVVAVNAQNEVLALV